MQEVLTVLGARPQFIDAGALSPAFKDTDGFEEISFIPGSTMTQI